VQLSFLSGARRLAATKTSGQSNSILVGCRFENEKSFSDSNDVKVVLPFVKNFFGQKTIFRKKAFGQMTIFRKKHSVKRTFGQMTIFRKRLSVI
jgi:hypothetical protein